MQNLADFILEEADPTPQMNGAGEQPDDTQPPDETLLTDDAADAAQDVVDDADEADQDNPTEPDEDIIIATINGEEREVTVTELLASYQKGAAADKKLQEAGEVYKRALQDGKTEGMQQAQVELQTQRQELEQTRTQLSELLGHVGQTLFAPRVDLPDPAMEQEDPIGYLTAKELWRDDQLRLQGLQQQIVQLTEHQRQQQAAEKERVMNENRAGLLADHPELATPEGLEAFSANVRRAASYQGFSADEVDRYHDKRGLKLLNHYGQLLAEKEAGGPTPAQRVVQKAKKPLQPGAATYRRAKSKQQRDANLKRARETGRVEDVAATLIIDG